MHHHPGLLPLTEAPKMTPHGEGWPLFAFFYDHVARLTDVLHAGGRTG